MGRAIEQQVANFKVENGLLEKENEKSLHT